MPPLSIKTKHYHRERVRSLIVQNPHISADGIRKAFELQGLTLDRHYIGSLLKAIHTERAKRAGRMRRTAGQMFNLGVESHDDLNDALVYLLQGLVSQGLELPNINWIET